VVDPGSIEEIAGSDGDVKTTKRELDMAKQLIESLSGDFDPSGYKDEYREAVLDMIERKAAGETITIEAPEPERKEVPDLMAALEASIAASKSPPKKRARASNGSGASKKKKAAAKK
jgi:DNA end-binding protein Ku